MNSSDLISKKKRRSSSRFLIKNKQAKLIISRKCRRVNILDRNRHINENDLSTNEDITTNTTEASEIAEITSIPMDINLIKIENKEPESIKPPLNEPTSNIENIKKNPPTSRLTELKSKFQNFKNSLVKSISNMKKPPSGTCFNQQLDKTHTVINKTANQISTTKQPIRKAILHPLNENLNPKTINEQHKRLQNNILVRSSSVSTIKLNIKTENTGNSYNSARTNNNVMKKYDSASICKLSTSSSNLSKENNRPAFNQYSKVTYKDQYLFKPSSVIESILK